MTATDELRRMLDERGVEWRYKDERTTYWYGTLDGEEWGEWTAIEMGDYLHLTFSANGDTVTPEEAIAATLGSGTCHYEIAFFGDGKAWFACSECGGMASADYDPPKYCPHCGRKVVDE